MSQVNIDRPVSHVTQQDENYCWACAFAMVLGRHSWAAALALADRCPASARNVTTGAVLDPGAAARAVGLSASRVRGMTPAVLAEHLGRSAVALFGTYRGSGRPRKHVMVASLLRGELTDPMTLTIGVDDPWANGTRWVGTWHQFVGSKLAHLDWLNR